VLQTDDRQTTDKRAIAYSERERQFTFAKKGTDPQIFGPCLLWPNDCMDEDKSWHGGRQRTCPYCARSTLLPSTKGHTPNFRPMLFVAKWLDGSRCHLVRRSASALATMC